MPYTASTGLSCSFSRSIPVPAATPCIPSSHLLKSRSSERVPGSPGKSQKNKGDQGTLKQLGEFPPSFFTNPWSSWPFFWLSPGRSKKQKKNPWTSLKRSTFKEGTVLPGGTEEARTVQASGSSTQEEPGRHVQGPRGFMGQQATARLNAL